LAGLLDSLALPDPAQARVMRIRHTLDLAQLELSEAFAAGVGTREDLTVLSEPAEWGFAGDDLLDLA
jgi:hypothetical protein